VHAELTVARSAVFVPHSSFALSRSQPRPISRSIRLQSVPQGTHAAPATSILLLAQWLDRGAQQIGLLTRYLCTATHCENLCLSLCAILPALFTYPRAKTVADFILSFSSSSAVVSLFSSIFPLISAYHAELPTQDIPFADRGAQSAKLRRHSHIQALTKPIDTLV
jgi:hypothetical protein